MAIKKNNVVPEVVNMDELAIATDAEIMAHANRLYNEVPTARSPKLLEIELAYLQREMQLRNVRYNLHVQYVKELQERELQSHD